MRIICRGLQKSDLAVEWTNCHITIGCSNKNDICLDSIGVSNFHAELIEQHQKLWVKDCGSLNGTFLNHKKISRETIVSHGDFIQIGVQQLHIEFLNDGECVILNFAVNILEEDNSEVETAKTIMADDNLKDIIKSGKFPPADINNLSEASGGGSAAPSLVITSTKDIFVEGREIGKYIVVKRIGKGGMGEIYLARHKTLGSYRALKVLPKALQEDNSKFFDRFLREAKFAAEIKHPNVIGVMDVETDEVFGFHYIVMEYIDGGSLRRILKTTKHLTEEQSVIIVQAVAAALMAAEERKIVHRDIKPDNIMFTKRGEVKLADLGIAKNDEEDNELTKTNVMIGTPAYLSPEQVQNAKAVDIRADIYSLGASFYEMLTGQHPYPGENTYEILHKLFADPVPDPRKITPEISAATADIVMKMLAKDAKDRFQNVAELITVMDKTFPHHTAMESAELIKKAISGICEENVTFSSGITVTGLGVGGRRIWLKKVAIAGIVIALLITGGIYYRLVFGERGRGDMKFTKPDGKINDFGVKNIASESFSGLTFKTIPHGEIKLTASDGGVQLFSADENGFLEIPNFRNGKYQVKISGKNFIPFEKNIDLLNDIILEAKLIKDVKSLKIHATPNAKLKLSGIENPDRELLVPGSGILEVGDLVSDTILIRCEAAGYETYEQSLVLNKDSELLIDGRPIKNVLNLKTVPLAGVVLKRGEKIFFTAQSDALGNCCIEGIPFGVYQLHISNNDYEPLISECDLTSDKNITLLPKKIVYDIVVKSLAGAQIRLLKDNQLQGTFFVPESGILKLTALPKGEYAILADKDGFDNEQLDFFVDKSQAIKCSLKEKIVAQGYNGAKNTPAVSSASTGETTAKPPEQKTSTHVSPPVQDGQLVLLLDGNSSLIEYAVKKSLEIKIGDGKWTRITKMPFKQSLPPGIYSVQLRIDKMQPLSAKKVQVADGKECEVVFSPMPYPVGLTINCPAPEAKFILNSKWYACGESVTIEPFSGTTIMVSAPGFQSKEVSYTATTPGLNDSITVTLDKSEIILSTNPNYIAGEKALKAGEPKTALELFMCAANDGDPEGMFQVACIYESGIGLSAPDQKTAYDFYIKAAKYNHCEAAYRAGKFLLGKNIFQNNEEMIQLFSIASSQKHPEADFLLGQFSESGKYGMEKDLNAALRHYLAAAEQNHPAAMFSAGQLLEQKYDFKSAIKWYEKAAEGGIKKAEDRLKILGNLK